MIVGKRFSRSMLAGAIVVLLLAPAYGQVQAVPGNRIEDQVTAWASQLKAEAEALRAEGADEAVRTLERMSEAEAKLLERLRSAVAIDELLPDMSRTWSEGADELNRLSARMPEIQASNRRRLQNLRGILGQAQTTGRGVERELTVMRAQLEAMRARVKAAVPGSPEALRAEVEAAAQAAALTAREAQGRLVAGFATQGSQALRRLEDASQGMELLATAISAHARVLQASSDLARTRAVARAARRLITASPRFQRSSGRPRRATDIGGHG